MKITVFAALLFALTASGQTIERQFHLAGSATPRQTQELLTTIRTVFGIQSLKADQTSSTINVGGPATLVNGVEWFLHDLEQPDDIRAGATHEYSITGDRYPLVRAFYLKPDATELYVQELLTAVRVVPEIQKTFSCSAPAVLVVRGDKAQVDLAGWIISEMENADSATAEHQFRPDSGNGSTARVFFNPGLSTQEILDKLHTLRTNRGVQRAFNVSSRHAVALLGNDADVVAAEQLFR